MMIRFFFLVVSNRNYWVKGLNGLLWDALFFVSCLGKILLGFHFREGYLFKVLY